MSAFKEAAETIPGWEDYASGATHPKQWDGVTFSNSVFYRTAYEQQLIDEGKLEARFSE